MDASLICWRLSIAIHLSMDDILITLVFSNHLVKAHYRLSGRKESDKPIMQLLGVYVVDLASVRAPDCCPLEIRAQMLYVLLGGSG